MNRHGLSFLREARAAASVRHPNVASVFHLGRTGQNYFYAMEFVEGETLEKTVAEGLSVFKHYGKEFFADRIVRPSAEEIQEMIAPQTKVTWFVDRHLNTEEKKRFFPVLPGQGTIPAP